MAGAHVWPVDAVSGAPLFTGRQGRQLAVAPFVAGATATRPLGAFSGVRPGTPTTTVTATSTTWTVGEHAGIIDAELAAEAGPYTYSFDAVQTGTMTAADPSNPRIDVIYVRIDDPAESDGTSTPAAAIGYQAGTPAATPAAPTTWTGSARSMVLAQINVPKVGGGSPSVTWVAPTLVAAGGIYPSPSAAQMAALNTAATTAAPVLVDDGGVIKRSIGTGWTAAAWTGGWVAYAPAWTGSTTSPTLGNGTLVGRYMLIGKTCYYSLQLTIGSTTNGGAGSWGFTLPFAAATWQAALGWVSSYGLFAAPVAGLINGAAITNMAEGRNSLTAGYALAAGSLVLFTGVYEIA